MTRPMAVRFGALAVACSILSGACGSQHQAQGTTDDTSASAPSNGGSALNPPRGLGLRPVTLPDFSRMEASVREQMRARSSAVTAGIEHPGSRADLGAAYGELGKLLMATTYFEAAEACYLNAETLAPGDVRWPYYLGHLYKARGPLAKSIASFEKALQMRPNDMATVVWLGNAAHD
jgi:tetratricopeptide (TPR) repeat protein